ncbi:MAG: riboflavin synthase, partial [Desulfobulbia bacterium]
CGQDNFTTIRCIECQMFTGLITDVGTLENFDGVNRQISSGYQLKDNDVGASIACDGCCLTVVSLERAEKKGTLFTVQVSGETLKRTKIGSWKSGTLINLERPLTLGTELGGHIVTGHVDGVGEILSAEPDGECWCYRLEIPVSLAGFIAPKGSVALDGTSLTVNDVSGTEFEVTIIPHTRNQTNWRSKTKGDLVNLEVDLLARYVARLQQVKDWG